MTFYTRTTDAFHAMIDEVWNYIIYLRKSRSDSPLETVEEVLEKHERQLQELAEKMFGARIPEENIFREVVSGETIADRPEMKKVLERIESKNIVGVIVIEPQRLSRGDLVDCGNIIRAFKYTDTKVITLTRTYDLSDRHDERYFKDELMRGSEYLEYTKEILSRGRLASVAEGNYLGSTPPYGYDKTMIVEGHRKHPTLKINEAEANAVRLIFDMFANQNMTPHAIRRKLEEMGIKPRKAEYFSTATIRDIVQNPHYIGKVVWNRHKTEKNYVDGEIVKSRPRHKEFLLFEGKHQSIVSQELWDRAQERRGKNAPFTAERELVNPLAKIIFCQCGRAMSYNDTSKSARGYEAPRLICTHQTRCRTRSAKYDDVVDALVEALKAHLEDFEIKLVNGDGDSEKLQLRRLENIQSELEELEHAEDKLFDFLEREIYSEEEFVKRKKKLTERREELQVSYNKLKSTLPSSIDYEDKIVKLHQAIDALKDPTISAKAKNDFLHEIIERVVYTTYIVEGGRKFGRWEESRFELDVFLKL